MAAPTPLFLQCSLLTLLPKQGRTHSTTLQSQTLSTRFQGKATLMSLILAQVPGQLVSSHFWTVSSSVASAASTLTVMMDCTVMGRRLALVAPVKRAHPQFAMMGLPALLIPAMSQPTLVISFLMTVSVTMACSVTASRRAMCSAAARLDRPRFAVTAVMKAQIAVLTAKTTLTATTAMIAQKTFVRWAGARIHRLPAVATVFVR
jgi:hypothetical protein